MSAPLEPPPPTATYLCFSVGRRRLALPAPMVGEVTPHLPLTTLPLAPPHLLGVVNLRGRPVTVLDLSALIGMGPSHPTDLYIIATALDMRVALPVKHVHGVEQAVTPVDGPPELSRGATLLDLPALLQLALAKLP